MVDLPGQSARVLKAWLSEADILRFAFETDIKFTYWHVLDGGYASVSEFGQTLDYFGGNLQHVAVKNFGRGGDFGAFENSDARRRLDELQGRVIEIPELQSAAMYAIDHGAFSFWAAIHNSEGERALRPLDRQRVRLWLEHTFAAIDSIADVI